jgi:hypothetical protein
MSYQENEFKSTNTNYINKDFATMKNSLMEYAKSYFPDTYKDFNETSPGMMLIEMSAYVGDVLSFYIDQQYRESLLPLAEERRNIVTLAGVLGYKIRPIIPATVKLTMTQTVAALADGEIPDYSEGVTIERGMQVEATSNSDVKFETLDVVDFRVSGSIDPPPSKTNFNDDGIAQNYELQRIVKAISAETITRSFPVGSPVKFLKIDLPEDNVIDIISIIDASNNTYYQVDYLAQDKVPLETHYTADSNRDTAYSQLTGVPSDTITLPVPYTLEFIRTPRRFIKDVSWDGVTSIVFGNGILRSGQSQESIFQQTAQTGIGVPGKGEHLVQGVDPLLGDEYSTLGNTPSHTSLTVTYRVGGGISTNVTANDLTTINSSVGAPGSPAVGGATLSVTNSEPARGGSDQESAAEIRERATAFFTTQNRCVTRQDYEARILNMSSKFGNIAKVYVQRSSTALQTITSNTSDAANQLQALSVTIDGTPYIPTEDVTTFLQDSLAPLMTEVESGIVPTIDAYTLSYNNNKELVETPQDPLGQNIKTYLSEYRMITDEVTLRLNQASGGGYIINFGVYFDVVAHRYANKAEVKLKCMQKITDYFNIDRMQFRQPLYISQLEYELMGIDGVRAVNYICLSQFNNYKSGNSSIGLMNFPHPTYTYMYTDEANDGSGGWVVDPTSGIPSNYGYKYDFEVALKDGMIRPSATPAVFELKDPQQNIKGIIH